MDSSHTQRQNRNLRHPNYRGILFRNRSLPACEPVRLNNRNARCRTLFLGRSIRSVETRSTNLQLPSAALLADLRRDSGLDESLEQTEYNGLFSFEANALASSTRARSLWSIEESFTFCVISRQTEAVGGAKENKNTRRSLNPKEPCVERFTSCETGVRYQFFFRGVKNSFGISDDVTSGIFDTYCELFICVWMVSGFFGGRECECWRE